MKGTLGLLAIAGVIWAFWMTYEWLRNNKKENKRKNKQ
jgi:hypothetical protein